MTPGEGFAKLLAWCGAESERAPFELNSGGVQRDSKASTVRSWKPATRGHRIGAPLALDPQVHYSANQAPLVSAMRWDLVAVSAVGANVGRVYKVAAEDPDLDRQPSVLTEQGDETKALAPGAWFFAPTPLPTIAWASSAPVSNASAGNEAGVERSGDLFRQPDVPPREGGVTKASALSTTLPVAGPVGRASVFDATTDDKANGTERSQNSIQQPDVLPEKKGKLSDEGPSFVEPKGLSIVPQSATNASMPTILGAVVADAASPRLSPSGVRQSHLNQRIVARQQVSAAAPALRAGLESEDTGLRLRPAGMPIAPRVTAQNGMGGLSASIRSIASEPLNHFDAEAAPDSFPITGGGMGLRETVPNGILPLIEDGVDIYHLASPLRTTPPFSKMVIQPEITSVLKSSSAASSVERTDVLPWQQAEVSTPRPLGSVRAQLADFLSPPTKPLDARIPVPDRVGTEASRHPSRTAPLTSNQARTQSTDIFGRTQGGQEVTPASQAEARFTEDSHDDSPAPVAPTLDRGEIQLATTRQDTSPDAPSHSDLRVESTAGPHDDSKGTSTSDSRTVPIVVSPKPNGPRIEPDEKLPTSNFHDTVPRTPVTTVASPRPGSPEALTEGDGTELKSVLPRAADLESDSRWKPQAEPVPQESNIHLQLRTAELGRVQIETAMHEGHVTTAVTVENNSAKHAIASELTQLQSSLAAHDMHLESASVSTTTRLAADWTSRDGRGESGSEHERQQQALPTKPHLAPDPAEDEQIGIVNIIA